MPAPRSPTSLLASLRRCPLRRHAANEHSHAPLFSGAALLNVLRDTVNWGWCVGGMGDGAARSGMVPLGWGMGCVEALLTGRVKAGLRAAYRAPGACSCVTGLRGRCWCATPPSRPRLGNPGPGAAPAGWLQRRVPRATQHAEYQAEGTGKYLARTLALGTLGTSSMTVRGRRWAQRMGGWRASRRHRQHGGISATVWPRVSRPRRPHAQPQLVLSCMQVSGGRVLPLLCQAPFSREPHSLSLCP